MLQYKVVYCDEEETRYDKGNEEKDLSFFLAGYRCGCNAFAVYLYMVDQTEYFIEGKVRE